MEQSLQRAGPDETGIERRGQDGSSLFFANTCQQKPFIGPFASVQSLNVLNDSQGLFVCIERVCRRLTVVFALLQEFSRNVKFSFISGTVAKTFSFQPS